jgi:hypothetical protein
MVDAIKQCDILAQENPGAAYMIRQIKASIEEEIMKSYQKGYEDAQIAEAVHKSKVIKGIKAQLRESAMAGSTREKIAYTRAALLVEDLL